VKIQKGVEPLFPEGANKSDEVGALLFYGDDDGPVDQGMAFDQAAIGFLDDVGQRRFGETAFEQGDGGGRQDDIAEAAKAEKKDGTGSQLNL